MPTPLSPDTTLGLVSLAVQDLDRSLAFYQDRLGLRLHRREGDTVYLGTGGRRDLVALTGSPSARRPRGTTGLYHFALLLPTRAALAEALQHLAATRTPLQGMADHLVSEAIYLADPDGNGIEIYSDRPRETWQYDGSMLRMTTEPLDVDDLMSEPGARDASSWGGLPRETVVGHVHLHVADIPAAEHFYRDVLGFDLTTRYGRSASFVSAGGYHHHIAFNTWAGAGAPPPPPGALGLRHVVIRLPDAQALEGVVRRVTDAGIAMERSAHGVLVRDPSANALLFTNAAAAPSPPDRAAVSTG